MHGTIRFSLAILSVGALALPAAAQASGPTRAQIDRAIKKAERSRNLWATVDICNTKHHPRVLGIRGQMPSLGFPASHEMNIRVDYQPTPKIGFKPSKVHKSVPLGNSKNRLLQGGWSWQFPKHTGPLRGTVTFVWRRGHQLLGRITKRTTGGHHDVDFGDPRRFSAAQCTIP
jgi:hypothetical protein